MSNQTDPHPTPTYDKWVWKELLIAVILGVGWDAVADSRWATALGWGAGMKIRTKCQAKGLIKLSSLQGFLKYSYPNSSNSIVTVVAILELNPQEDSWEGWQALEKETFFLLLAHSLAKVFQNLSTSYNFAVQNFSLQTKSLPAYNLNSSGKNI